MFPSKFKGVPLFNKTPRKYDLVGGYVKKHPDMTRQQLNNDSVKAILMPGELVIPFKHRKFEDGGLVRKVVKYLKQDLGVKLPGT
jgi:hypothetical protein